MKCQLSSKTTHRVLLSKEIGQKSYKEICSGEPKKVNIGYNNDKQFIWVENNTLIPGIPPQRRIDFQVPYGDMLNSWTWEVLPVFFSLHNIEPNWLNCHFSWGRYSTDLGGWTGCVGKV